MAESFAPSFIRFMRECKSIYDDVCHRIDNGDVPAGAPAQVMFEIPPNLVDEIRFDRLAAAARTDA
jgi:hypothetical protein